MLSYSRSLGRWGGDIRGPGGIKDPENINEKEPLGNLDSLRKN